MSDESSEDFMIRMFEKYKRQESNQAEPESAHDKR